VVLLALGLRARHALGHAPWLGISCDNLPDNSTRLRQALLQFLGETAPEVGRWLEGEGRFANTLVDSIAPAVTPALRERVARALGRDDAAAVHREPYTQWVLEDPGNLPCPAWEAAGALWVADVKPWELAKLRVLNGGHSTLAYGGLLLGLETMADAMATPLLAGFAERMLREEVLPTLRPAQGLEPAAYLRSVLGRIGNPHLGHRLAQIGMDGSQKLPLRLLPCIRENLAAGRPVARLCLAVGLWLCFVRDRARHDIALADPADAALRAAGRGCTGDAQADVDGFLAVRAAFDADFAALPAVRAALAGAYATLGDASPAAIARAFELAGDPNAGVQA
jgi:fructuronate reductase